MKIEAICKDGGIVGMKSVVIGMHMTVGEKFHDTYARLLDDTAENVEDLWDKCYEVCLSELNAKQ